MFCVVIVTLLVVAAPTIGQQTCTADCNCDLSNIQLLDQVIEARVNQSFVNEPSKLEHTQQNIRHFIIHDIVYNLLKH